MKAIDISSQKFGRWTVLERAGRSGSGTLWLCQCDCGVVKSVRSHHLRGGMTKSCGCLAAEATTIRSTSHGHARRKSASRTFRIWAGMKNRCFNENDHIYQYYGLRGINVCQRWMSFENFLADMGECPAPKMSIERIDNELGYEPGNCRWATRSEQMRNTRQNVNITILGRTQCLAAWCAEFDIDYKRAHGRYRANKPLHVVFERNFGDAA